MAVLDLNNNGSAVSGTNPLRTTPNGYLFTMQAGDEIVICTPCDSFIVQSSVAGDIEIETTAHECKIDPTPDDCCGNTIQNPDAVFTGCGPTTSATVQVNTQIAQAIKIIAIADTQIAAQCSDVVVSGDCYNVDCDPCIILEDILEAIIDQPQKEAVPTTFVECDDPSKIYTKLTVWDEETGVISTIWLDVDNNVIAKPTADLCLVPNESKKWVDYCFTDGTDTYTQFICVNATDPAAVTSSVIWVDNSDGSVLAAAPAGVRPCSNVSHHDAFTFCDDNAGVITEFIRHIEHNTDGTTTVVDTLLDGSTVYATTGTVGLCVSSVEADPVTLCDDNGQFLRHFVYDSGVVSVADTYDTDLSGAAYTTVGTVTACENADFEPLILCDTNGATVTQFIRHYKYENGSVTSADTTLDGVTAYTVAGTEGSCDDQETIVQTKKLCDLNGTVQTSFFRHFTFVNGVLTGTPVDTDLSGAAYTATGAVGCCDDKETSAVPIVLCDVNAGVSTTFIRHIVYVDGVPNAALSTDTELDAITAYTATGIVGICTETEYDEVEYTLCAKVAGTGYAAGDKILVVRYVDTQTGVTASTGYYNLTQGGTQLATAPAAADLGTCDPVDTEYTLVRNCGDVNDNNIYWVRFTIVNGVQTLEVVDGSGAVITPPVGLQPCEEKIRDTETIQQCKLANTDGAGFTDGDSVTKFVCVDKSTTTPTVLGVFYFNNATNAVITITEAQLEDCPNGAKTVNYIERHDYDATTGCCVKYLKKVTDFENGNTSTSVDVATDGITPYVLVGVDTDKCPCGRISIETATVTDAVVFTPTIPACADCVIIHATGKFYYQDDGTDPDDTNFIGCGCGVEECCLGGKIPKLISQDGDIEVRIEYTNKGC